MHQKEKTNVSADFGNSNNRWVEAEKGRRKRKREYRVSSRFAGTEGCIATKNCVKVCNKEWKQTFSVIFGIRTPSFNPSCAEQGNYYFDKVYLRIFWVINSIFSQKNILKVEVRMIHEYLKFFYHLHHHPCLYMAIDHCVESLGGNSVFKFTKPYNNTVLILLIFNINCYSSFTRSWPISNAKFDEFILQLRYLGSISKVVKVVALLASSEFNFFLN